MSAGCPVLPPLRVRRSKSGSYLYTYDHKWIPATKGPDGEVIKKGRTVIYNKKIVGKLVKGDKASFAVFHDEFLEQYPELRYFTAFRNKDHSWVFKKTLELDSDTPNDKEVIDLLIEKHDYTVDDDGKVIKSADDIKMCVNPADIALSKNFEDGRTILEKRPERSRNHSKDLICTVQAGSIALMEELSRSTGLSAAILQAVKLRCKKERRGYSAKKVKEIACSIETFIIYMVMTSQNTYEGYEAFVSTHAVKESAFRSRKSVMYHLELIDEAFLDAFHKVFIKIYKGLRHESISKQGLYVSIDGSSFEHCNTELDFISEGYNKDKTYKSQFNLQMVVDSAPGGLPLFCMMFDGRTNDIATYKQVLDKACKYGLNFEWFLTVCDRGYSSTDNFEHAFRKETMFVMNCRKSQGAIVTNMIDEAIQNGILVNTTWARPKMRSLTGGRVSYWSKKVTYTYDNDPVEGKRASKKAHADVTFHVFFDKDIFNRECEVLDNRLASALQKLDEGEPLTTTEIALLKKCSNFNEKEYEPGSPLKTELEINIASYHEESKYYGFQVLATNDNSLTSEEVKETYIRRVTVETTFQIHKQGLHGNTTKAKGKKGLVRKVALHHFAAILKTELNYRTTCARAANPGKHSDVFRSTKSVLQTFSSVIAEKYEAGYVMRPIIGKQLHAFKCLGIPLPKSELSLSKTEDSLSSDDDRPLDYEEL